MTSRHIRKKRKIAPVDAEYDSDCIIVNQQQTVIRRSRINASPEPQRFALEDLDPLQSQNKRRRTLKCVLIPRPCDEATASSISSSHEPLRLNDGHEQSLLDSPLTGLTASDEVNLEAKAPESDSKTLSLPQNTKHRVDVVTAVQKQSGDATTGRPVRAAKRQSYLDQWLRDDTSEDEIALLNLKTARQPKGRKKAHPSDESEFEAGEESNASELEADADDFDDSSSVASVEVDDGSDVEAAKSAARSKGTVRKAAARQATSVKNPVKSHSKPAIKTGQKKDIMFRSRGGLDESLPPLSGPSDMFADIAEKAIRLGFEKAAQHVGRRPIRIATMCSGTESPLHAMQMFQEALKQATDVECKIEHLFSAELDPVKQAYIERNYSPPILFRDVTELTTAMEDDVPMATTAYGAKVPVPLDVDVVIAGTSCIDFSRLNSHRKTLDDEGESGQTWQGVLAYCTATRPPIVILENVYHAEWETMLKHYEEAEYDTAVVMVDSKDYYIPQTRQRGYMICFDNRRSKAHGLSRLAAKWQSLMEEFRRPASSPHVDFLLPNDQIVPRTQLRSEEATREVNWSRCELRHIKYRQEMKLGIDRPYTHWQESGTVVVPEGYDPSWLPLQVERVKDTYECSILRNMLPERGMFDSQYKTRIWDVSQNIDRNKDHNPWGVMGCVTPSAQFVVSDARRPMMPEEQMMLQGFSLDRISFTTETPAEIQDLAGNAMTTTVIGCAIVSALISGHELLRREDVSETVIRTASRTAASSTMTGGAENRNSTSQTIGMDLKPFIDAARQSLRRCVCEGPKSVAAKPIQQCIDCGHTSCVSCGIEPAHSYRQGPLPFPDRLHPVTFEESMKAHLPLRLAFEHVEDLVAALPNLTDSKLLSRYGEAVKSAVRETFAFTSLRRTVCWTAKYESPNARLELVIDANSSEWRIYAKPNPGLARRDALRKAVEQPVMKANAEGVAQQQWLRRTPSSSSVAINIRPGGNHIPSQWARNQMPEFLDHMVPEYLHVEASSPDSLQALEVPITGKYKHVPKCGKACQSLWIRESDSREMVYLFLDPTRLGNPKEDGFVFSANKSELEYDEIRPVLARVDPAWRPWSRGRKDATTKTSVTFDGIWTMAPDSLHIQPSELELQLFKPRVVSVPRNCDSPSLLIDCVTSSNEAETKGHLNPSNAFVFEAMRRHLKTSDWSSVEDLDLDVPCAGCAPPKPALRWEFDEKKGVVRPFEDPLGAAQYERAVKAGLNPIVIQLDHLSPNSVSFKVGIHLRTLAHRAAARLPQGLHGKSAIWRVDTISGRNPAPMTSYRLQPTSNVEPFADELEMGVTLFPIQQRALTWMRHQEAGDGHAFMLEECEEATSSEAGWRAEVRVTMEVRVRGGICADHPGFGKTITTLALMQGELRDKSPAAILNDIKHHQNQEAPGLIAVAANLIVCPGTLVKQWVDEIKEKLGRKDVLVINSMSDLAKCTIQSFRNARFIVASRAVLVHETYAEKLASFVGRPGPATKSGSSYEAWLGHVLGRVPDHLTCLEESGPKTLEKRVKAEYKNTLSDDTFAGCVPSRRVRGVEKAASSKKSAKSLTARPAAAEVNTANLTMPLFEMFYFTRLVIDEFQQYDDKELTALKNVKAHRRWALSGTPPLNDTYEVSQLAALLGVYLPTGAGARGRMKLKNIRKMEKDRTDFERFDAMRQMPSDVAHARLREHNQEFLDAFVRRNILELGHIQYEEHLVPIKLDLDHRARYTEISQHLNSLGMRIQKASKTSVSVNTDKRARFLLAVDGIDSAEEALSRDAAFFDRRDSSQGNNQTGLDQWIAMREKEVQQSLVNLSKAAEAVRKVKGGQSEDWAIWQKNRLTGGTLGDDETIQLVQDVLSSNGQYGANQDYEPDIAHAGDSTPLSRLMGIVDQLLILTRSLRYLQGVRHIQSAAESVGSVMRCDAERCNGVLIDDPVGTQHVGVSAYCGHKLCKSCHRELRDHYHTRCPAPGCRGTVEDYHLLWNHKMGGLTDVSPSPLGAKWQAAVGILGQVRKQSDQAILFVQYTNQLDEAQIVLDHAGISCRVVQSGDRASHHISEFQDQDNDITVLVLNASDETAAGLNLQSANHVIFLSPLLRDTQYGYDSTMKQAIGRVRRYGQKKLIHVYHLVALDTIDVDILEHRARRSTALQEQTAPPIQPPPGLKQVDVGVESEVERTQLVCEDGKFSLRPRSWLVRCGIDGDAEEVARVRGKSRVLGWEDYSSLVKFSKAYTEDDD